MVHVLAQVLGMKLKEGEMLNTVSHSPFLFYRIFNNIIDTANSEATTSLLHLEIS